MKSGKLFIIGAYLWTCAMGVVSLPLAAADNNTSKRVRRDIPWVSLAHQRELAQKAEKSEDNRPKTVMGSSAEKTSVVEPKVADKKDSKVSDDKKASIWSKFTLGSRPELSADKFDYAADGSGNLIARGNAKISDKNFEIDADTVEFIQSKALANASGDVRVTLEPARLLSDNLHMDMNSDSMKSGYTRFGAMPIFIESESMSASRAGAEFNENNIYFNEPSFAGFNASADRVSYDAASDVVSLEGATFKVGDIPFFYALQYSQKGLKKPPFYLRNGIGYNGDYGAYISNTILYTGLENLDVGGLLDYYTKRSVLFGPAVNYNFEAADFIAEGWAQGAYINDQGGSGILGTDSLGRPIKADRFFIEWRNKAMVSDRVGIVADVNYWSDEYVTRDFRDEFFYDNQTPDNFVEASYYGDSFIGSLFTRFRPNDWEQVQQRLPEARFDLPAYEILNTGAYQNFFVSYGYFRDSDPYTIEDYVDSTRLDAYYGIARPIQLNPWSKITPVIGGRLTYYGNAKNGSSDYIRMLGQVGFDAQMDIWGFFDYKSETMGIDGIRHHITPMISYRYIPNAEQGFNRIPHIDDYYLSTYPPILDLGTMRNVDMLLNTNTMRFGIRNVFETRDSEYGSREIGRFDVFQDVNFEKQPLAQTDGLQSYSDLYINASINPARWLTLGVYNRINTNHIGIPEINTYVGLYDGDALELYFISTYLSDSLTQYSVQADYRISECYKIFGRWAYDYRTSTLTDQTYGLWTRLGNTWIIEYVISYRSDSQRQNGFSAGMRVNVSTF